ncbi:TIGR02594 family protein [Flavobacterium sp. FlaQc-50]|uniref:TIGR02594 family protein n=1 Tax=unclassified Flavobacterium TaxID=196869 RepID=UPI0037577E41
MANIYSWLKNEKSPKVIVEALKLLGIKEVPGQGDNITILKWAEALGLEKTYRKDDIPWCGLFVAYVCKVAGVDGVKDPLWARNWTNFGTKQTVAMLGDILVFVRDGGGHVGFYVGEDSSSYHVLGGNQSDMVCITRIRKERCIGIRRTKWKVAQPDNVRVIKLAASGAISENES